MTNRLTMVDPIIVGESVGPLRPGMAVSELEALVRSGVVGPIDPAPPWNGIQRVEVANCVKPVV